MNKIHFLKYQIKNNKKFVIVYEAVFLFLILNAIILWKGQEGAALVNGYFACMGVVSMCLNIIGIFPMILLSVEIIDFKTRPHIFTYSYCWDRRDNILNYVLSLIMPMILSCIINGLYSDIVYIEQMRYGDLWINTIEHLTVIFVLASISFCIGMYVKSYVVTFMIVLIYVLFMSFFEIPALWYNLISIQNYYANDWWLRCLFWVALGIFINEVGLYEVKKLNGEF